VDNLLPAGGLSLLTAKPKTGKSTLARAIAAAIAKGFPILGRPSIRVPVIYLALEDKRHDVRRHFEALGIGNLDPFYVHVGMVPEKPLEWLDEEIKKTKARFVVIDPLVRFLRIRDIKDYAEASNATQPLIQRAHTTDTHFLFTTHAPK